MELEPVSSCCSSISQSMPSSSAADSSTEDAVDRTELEAAEALAEFAQLAILRDKVFESAAKWGSKGKRVRRRVQKESSPCDSRLKSADSKTPTLYLTEERAAEEEQDQPVSRNLTILESVKDEVDQESPKRFLVSALRGRSTGGGRSKQNLSETEKEERRIRRVLANRESARQTIRRRQALSEELTRKAADLTYANMNLKREKDLALKEYQSLETINKKLKEQVLRSKDPGAGELQELPTSSQVETSASPPFCFYNQHPFQLFCWPSVIQSSHLVQSRLVEPPNGFTAPCNTSAVVPAKVMPSQEREVPADENFPKPPLYFVACPWFVPAPDQSHGIQSHVYFEPKNTQEGINTSCHASDDSSSRPLLDMKTMPSHSPCRDKEEDSSSTETRPLYDLNESAAEEHQLSGGPTFALKHEDTSQPANGLTLVPPAHVLISLPGKNQGFVEYPSRKLVDTVAAAEARKRRKELTKLKNHHGRQCRMQV